MYTQRLKLLRKSRHLYQGQIADLLHCSQKAYSHWENGTRGLPIECLITLARFYAVSTDYILGLTDEAVKLSS